MPIFGGEPRLELQISCPALAGGLDVLVLFFPAERASNRGVFGMRQLFAFMNVPLVEVPLSWEVSDFFVLLRRMNIEPLLVPKAQGTMMSTFASW